MSISKQKKRAIFAAVLALCAGPALALECTFTTECMEAEACGETEFSASFATDDEALVTDFGDLSIESIVEDEDQITVFATGEGANYMLTVVENDGRMAVHMTEDSMMINYTGMCLE